MTHMTGLSLSIFFFLPHSLVQLTTECCCKTKRTHIQMIVCVYRLELCVVNTSKSLTSYVIMCAHRQLGTKHTIPHYDEAAKEVSSINNNTNNNNKNNDK